MWIITAALVGLIHVAVAAKTEDLVYKYEVDYTTKIAGPREFGTRFNLKGDLHKREELLFKRVYFWLDNLEVSVVVGDVEKKSPKWSKLSDESTAYLNPFAVTYSETTSLIETIVFPQLEPQWSKNLKKALASLFQFDKTVTTNTTVFENTVSGRCEVEYSGTVIKDGFMLEKSYTPKEDCKEYDELLFSNTDGTICSEPASFPYFNSMNSNIEFNSDHFIRSIESEYLATYGDLEQLVRGSQKLQFIEMREPSKTIDPASVSVSEPLTHIAPSPLKKLVELTSGFHIDSTDEFIETVMDLLVQVGREISPEDLKVNNLKVMTPINRIYYLLKMFEVESFEKLYQVLIKSKDDQVLQRFFRLLPGVKTYHSSIFVRDLITSGRVSNEVAASLLYMLDANFLGVFEEYWRDFEVFYSGDFAPNVKSASLLTFSNPICLGMRKNSTTAKKYIDYYYNQLKTATKYEDQLVWLLGLSNICSDEVYDLIKPIVRGEQVLDLQYDRHLRAIAFYRFVRLVKDHTADEVYDLFWPIVQDQTLHIELRMNALINMIEFCSNDKLLEVYNWITKSGNQHLKTFFQHTVFDMFDGDAECQLTADRKALYNEIQRKNTGFTVIQGSASDVDWFYDNATSYGMYSYSFITPEDQTGHMIKVMSRYDNIIGDKRFGDFRVSIKIGGFRYPYSTFFEDYFTSDAEQFAGKTFERTDEPIHIEIIFAYAGQVEFVKYLDEEALKKLTIDDLRSLIELIKYKFSDSYIALQKEVFFPTDLGVTNSFYEQLPFLVLYADEGLVALNNTSQVDDSVRIKNCAEAAGAFKVATGSVFARIFDALAGNIGVLCALAGYQQ